MLVIYHNDADGRCAAAVVRKWMMESDNPGEIRFHEMDYKDPCPLDQIHEDEAVFIVDFSFKPDDMKAVREKAGWVGWCDHHITAKEYDYAQEPIPVPGVRDFTDKGLCGAEVTWQYLFHDKPIPFGLRLLGDYDSWRMEQAPLTLAFYEGLKVQVTHPESPTWENLLGEDSEAHAMRIAELGGAAILYRNAYCAEMRESFGYETTICGTPAYACNIYKFGSQGFGARMEEYPLCISYVHDGLKYTVSLYSLDKVDVSAIAKEYGGGGHKGAAGFTCERLPFRKIEVAKDWQ